MVTFNDIVSNYMYNVLWSLLIILCIDDTWWLYDPLRSKIFKTA